jgi:hypothetical protein
MNVLSGGRPVAYMHTLDGLNFDYNGFVETGLVCHMKTWTPDAYALLKEFYAKPDWQGVMRSYDASYDADREALSQAAGETIRRYLGAT